MILVLQPMVTLANVPTKEASGIVIKLKLCEMKQWLMEVEMPLDVKMTMILVLQPMATLANVATKEALGIVIKLKS